MNTTRVSQHVRATRASVYQALLDARAVAVWMVPDGMSCEVHELDAREGGRLRISLTHASGTAPTDTYVGQYVKLVEDRLVIERVAFETTDPNMQGEMKITLALVDAEGGTTVFALHEGVPIGVDPAGNEAGWRASLAKLAAWVEAAL